MLGYIKLIFFLFLLFFSKHDIVKSQEIYTKSVIGAEELTINEMQKYMKKGYITSEILVNLYLDRIKKYNEQYNAIISINKNAIEKAKQLDKEHSQSGPRSPLHGIPIVIKDNIDFVGLPTTGGAMALFDSYPVNNALIVQKLIDAGAIIIGKTNMSTFSFSGSRSISSFGETLNAYNLNYSSYGSSGGTAVAVAANLAVVGIGTDTNSSVRGPAAANNLFGLRPTTGLVSRDGMLPFALERDTAGPMARTVTDLAILLDYIVGEDLSDITTNKNPAITYTNYLNKNGLNGLNIGIIKDFIQSNKSSNIPVLRYYDNQIKKLMDKSINTMKDLGANIIYIDNFYTQELHDLYYNSLDGYMFCYDANIYFSKLDPNNRIKTFQDLVNDGRYPVNLSAYQNHCNKNPRTSPSYNNLLNNKEQYRDYIEKIMQKYDIDAFAYPTLKKELIQANNNSSQIRAGTSYTISSTIGFPSINIPIGFDENGLPYGMEMTSRPFTEGMLIAMAYAFESVTDNRKSPSIAPNLYKIPDEVLQLIKQIDYAQNYNNSKKYTQESIDDLKHHLNIAKNYLKNYSTKDENPNRILLNLNNSIKNLEIIKIENENNTFKLNKSILKVIIILLTTTLFIKTILSKRKNKQKNVHK